MSKTPTYSEAFNELQTIVSEIEQGEVSVDLLSAKVKRAAELIAICKQALRSTEENVAGILNELEQDHEK